MRPSVSEAAEAVYASIAPATARDEENGWALLHFVHAWTLAMTRIYDVVHDGATGAPGWASVMHPSTAPDLFLDWLSLFVGRRPLPGESPQDKRNLIEGQVSLRRGSAQASRALAARYLTGEKFVLFSERNGSAWKYSVRTRASETPDPAKVLTALMEQKPAGMILDYATFANPYTYGDVDAAFATHQQIIDDPDYVTYNDLITQEPDVG